MVVLAVGSGLVTRGGLGHRNDRDVGIGDNEHSPELVESLKIN